MDILLNKITGFQSSDSVICIKQRGDGKTLYMQENPANVCMKFNLPPGKWTTTSRVRKLRKPLKFILPELAKPELYRDVKPFKFRIADNPSKVTISFAFANFSDIKCDPEIAQQCIPAFVFVMSHESGHNYYGGKNKDVDPVGYYESESKCDIYACYLMLKNGFNKSQCIQGIDFCLSDAEPAERRKQIVKDWLDLVKIEGEEEMESAEANNYTGTGAVAKRDGVAIVEAGSGDGIYSAGDEIPFKKGDYIGTVEDIIGSRPYRELSVIDKNGTSIIVKIDDLETAPNMSAILSGNNKTADKGGNIPREKKKKGDKETETKKSILGFGDKHGNRVGLGFFGIEWPFSDAFNKFFDDLLIIISAYVLSKIFNSDIIFYTGFAVVAIKSIKENLAPDKT